MQSRIQRFVPIAVIASLATGLSLISLETEARGGVHASARVSVHGGGGGARPRPPAGRPPAGGGGMARPPAGGPPPGGGRPPAPGYRPPPPGNAWAHPVAAGVAVATTAAVVGSIIYSLPPSCSTVSVNGFTYQQCGSTWYRPQYVGTSVQYVVVTSPY
jgi:hypothetical protein